MSPSLPALLLSTERRVQSDVRRYRRELVRYGGMTPAQVRYYSARCCWPSAADLLALGFAAQTTPSKSGTA